MSATLKILRLADVCREVGYDRKTVLGRLDLDEAEGTPGRRFPLPLKPTDERRKAKREWSWSSIHEWIESRKI